MWGDLSGYVWGKTDQEITVSVVNEREKQTYYGARSIADAIPGSRFAIAIFLPTKCTS
jgi:hypothetical protein